MSPSSQPMSGRTITAVLLAAIVSVRHAMAAGLYAIAAAACARAADAPRATRSTSATSARSVAPAPIIASHRRLLDAIARQPWAALSTVLATLSIARAFDLAEDVGNALRRIAYTEGWYQRRRPLQTAAVIAGLVAACVVVPVVVRAARDRVGELRIAIVATSGLIVLAALRTVSLHDIDGMLARRDRLVMVAEAGALAIITLAALTSRAARAFEH